MKIIRINKRLIIFSILFLLLLSISGESQVFATSVTPAPSSSGGFKFVYDNSDVQDEGEIDLGRPEASIYVTGANNLFDTGDSVTWTSNNPDVIDIVNINDPTKPNFAKITRKGPGYAMITALINHGSQQYSINCSVKVTLSVNYGNGVNETPPLENVLTTGYEVMVMDMDVPAKKTKTIYLEYADYTAINNNLVSWVSGNTDIVTVNEGVITAVGAGSTTVTITTKTAAGAINPKKQTVTIPVVVLPSVLNTDAVAGTPTKIHERVCTIKNKATYNINTNAKKASYLTWLIKDNSGNVIPAEGNSLMKYTINTGSGNLTIDTAKAGSYDIYGFVPVNGFADDGVGVDYIHIKFIVPIDINITNNEIVMNVGDTYDIIGNSNLPSASPFSYSVDPASSSVASVSSTGVITATAKGDTKVYLDYIDSSGLYTTPDITHYEIKVKVIDGIKLNMTEATIYTSGTLELLALTTDNTKKITWTSSKPEVAAVDSYGVVTGVAEGKATISASQTINGIVKTATCIVTVQQSVSSITIDPNELTINKQEYRTLYAKISPDALSNIKLKWVSSDTEVVKIIKTESLTATIQGQAGGTAVVFAINQENVIVGFCKVTVNLGVESIVLSQTSVTAKTTTPNLQLSATISPAAATNQKLKWISTDTSVATVSDNGLVDFVGSGTTSIIVSSVDNPSLTAMCKVTVTASITDIKLDDSTKKLNVGATYTLTYDITPTYGDLEELEWYTSDDSVVTVSSSGKVSAKKAGTATITVRSKENYDVSDTCKITVTQKSSGVTFDVTELEIKVGATATIKATVLPSSTTDKTLTWTSSKTSVATVDSDGVVTGVSKGTAVIKAKTSGGDVEYCHVTVFQAVNGLSLNYEEKTLVIGDTFKLKANIEPSTAETTSVTWSSSNSSVATVSTKGVVKGIKGGAVVITCKTDDGDYKATCVIQVVEPVTSITLNKTSYKLGLRKSFTLKATIKTNSATKKKVTWSSSNTSIATVNSSGKVTGKKKGYVTITARAQDGSDASANCRVRVVVAVTSITLNKSSVNTVEGRSFSLKAKVRPTNSTYRSVTWTSSDESIAYVNTKGIVTALKTGKVTITASANDNSGKKDTCHVFIKELTPATSVTVVNESLTMIDGESTILQKAIYPSDSTDRYTWESDNRMVATVDRSTGKIIAKSPGVAHVTVMTESGKTATATVTVIGLNSTNLVMEQYSKYKLEVIGVTNGVSWDVADSEIAVVTGGQVQSRRVGTTMITATVNGRKLYCKLKVVKIK